MFPSKSSCFSMVFFPSDKNPTVVRREELLRTPLRAALVLDEQGHMGGLATAAEAGRPAG